MNNNFSNTYNSSTEKEIKLREDFHKLFLDCPIPSNEILYNLGLFLNRQALSRIFFMHNLYELIIDVQGVIMEFGVRWGQNLALFETFRGMYEPFNYTREIIGFDTFEGFPSVSDQDGSSKLATKGSYAVTPGYSNYLEKVLDYHEAENPISHIKKSLLVKGDATKTINEYLAKCPEKIIALAYFDFDLYEPTKKCLETILPHLTKGSVLGFDELNHPKFPGETQAFNEVLGLANHRIIRSPLCPRSSYIVID